MTCSCITENTVCNCAVVCIYACMHFWPYWHPYVCCCQYPNTACFSVYSNVHICMQVEIACMRSPVLLCFSGSDPSECWSGQALMASLSRCVSSGRRTGHRWERPTEARAVLLHRLSASPVCLNMLLDPSLSGRSRFCMRRALLCSEAARAGLMHTTHPVVSERLGRTGRVSLLLMGTMNPWFTTPLLFYKTLMCFLR